MKLKIAAVIVALVALLGYLSMYTVREGHRAILLKLGEIKKTDIKPGLHFKLPLVETVRTFDTRLLTLDSQPERFLTSEKKNVMVDFFVKWRIDNLDQYYRSTRGDEQRALMRLSQIMKDGLRSEFGKLTIQQAVSGQRSKILGPLEIEANKAAKELGIQVVDVRLKRIDLPSEVAHSVYQRMEAERARVAADFRARGKEAAERIRANADRERTVILANAYRQAQILRGEGDAKAAEIYAKAYQKDPSFYAFYRSLEAYKKTFNGKNDVLVLEPNSQFFRYFNNAQGGSVPAK
ncbi:protease modulator HflC [Acidihalobacter ferrooxydans]|uniref:Protein HflC n=1 Tax=Acidihalobacter ferrooxydans TaxID=1765967 RepID=A0A1P8UI71_9GAMM|nr:protease modulator HflC [Acidihalobacter ferrooxydans]APZ43543.1 HflC protein [Acidihalobacter ferrooxydans]